MSTRPYDMAVFDLDGTLLHKGKLSSRTVSALKAARDAGCILAVCTGRCLGMLGQPVISHGLFSWFICSNGSVTLDSSLGIQAQNSLSQQAVCQALDSVASIPHLCGCFVNGKPYFDSKIITRWLRLPHGEKSSSFSWMALKMFLKHQRIHDCESFLRRQYQGVEKFEVSPLDATAIPMAMTILKQQRGIEPVVSGSNIEITPKGVSKGKALELLIAQLGIPSSRVIAFGDSGNDLSLSGVAGHLCSPSTGSDDIKEAADELILPPESDGVAQYLEKAFGFTEGK
ncbi:MAG: HAD hydrolase family protein [Sphaerochaetaceae bacterium]